MRISLLVADDERVCHQLVDLALSAWNPGQLKITHAYSPGEAVELAKKEAFHCALIDLHYGEEKPEGFDLIRALREQDSAMELIVLSNAGDFRSAQEAMRAGAGDFLAKGYGKDELIHGLERALERRRWRAMEKRVLAPGNGDGFVLAGGSPAMESLKQSLRKVASAGIPVLLEGETGSGKEMAARALHHWGRDPAGPFVPVNCAAVPLSTADSFFFGHERGAFTGADRSREGVFEEADGGTLFLDEINSLSLELQGKILRVLQEKEVRRLGGAKTRPVEFRLVAASNRALEDLVKAGEFREDLFFRINVLPIRIPALRERLEDLECLISYFVPDREYRPELLRMFHNHSWPGNVRELKNLLQALDALAEKGEVLGPEHLPENTLRSLAPLVPGEDGMEQAEFRRSQEERELEFLARAYRSCQGNISRLSRMLNADRSHLHQKLVKLGVHKTRS